ncbi:flavin reductase family protein [Nocardioides daphniae]|uniref:Flavin reductase n=1 Tax=Nocardioides daphniae TaxID=402297 RepID=A0A4P7UC43_9ACTN|nr:flavin reductase family protein [Nocardioides daphniae]QCC76539.1 flavin reductase [Nocardioides daphniae]GGD05568.1 putative oxidoreductase [Nocardioides daphniae]
MTQHQNARPQQSTDVTDQRALRDAYGTFPSGVVAVAARVGGQLVGIAASSFTSISVEPALVSFSIARSSQTWPVLREAGEIGVSVLADHHDLLCRQLAGPADQRFEGLRLRTSAAGAVLLDEAVSTFTTTIHSELEAGDHLIVLLEVSAVESAGDREPLVFHRSGFQRLHRDDLDPATLSGRINGEPVEGDRDADAA